MSTPLFRSAAIVGIGHTEYSRDSGRSEWQLAIEATQAAVADAGLELGQVDGLIRYSADNVNEAMLTETLGMPLRYHSQVGFGGQSMAAVLGHAAAAIHAGLATVVVAYRSLNGRSGARYGRAERRIGDDPTHAVATGRMAPSGAFAGPYGLLAPGQVMAMWAARYAHDAGIDADRLSAALGGVAVTQRRHASSNPVAIMRDHPLDLAGYLGSRWISEPLRLNDFCLETDGAAAVVIAAPGIVASTPHPPAWIWAAQQALREESMEVYTELANGPAHRSAAEQLFADAGITATDIDVAALYDASTIMVLLSLEGYGLCEVGQAWRLLSEQADTNTPNGLLVPFNTSGGHLSEGYVHGFNHIIEAVRQLRGTSPNQVATVETVLLGAAGASGAVLGR